MLVSKYFAMESENNHHTERKITARETLAQVTMSGECRNVAWRAIAGAAKSAHDFVVDQKDAVFVAEGAEFG